MIKNVFAMLIANTKPNTPNAGTASSYSLPKIICLRITGSILGESIINIKTKIINPKMIDEKTDSIEFFLTICPKISPIITKNDIIANK